MWNDTQNLAIEVFVRSTTNIEHYEYFNRFLKSKAFYDYFNSKPKNPKLYLFQILDTPENLKTIMRTYKGDLGLEMKFFGHFLNILYVDEAYDTLFEVAWPVNKTWLRETKDTYISSRSLSGLFSDLERVKNVK